MCLAAKQRKQEKVIKLKSTVLPPGAGSLQAWSLGKCNDVNQYLDHMRWIKSLRYYYEKNN